MKHDLVAHVYAGGLGVPTVHCPACRCPELEIDEGDGTHFWRTRPDGSRSCEWCLAVDERWERD